MVTAGKYRAKAVHGLVAQAGERLTPVAKVTFKILDGQFIGETVEWDGWLSDKARPRTFDALVLCGWDGDTSRDDWDQLYGLSTNEVIIDCKAETYTLRSGEERTTVKVAWVNPLRAAPKQADRGFLKSFGAQVRGEALAAAKRFATQAPVPVRPQPTPIVDDFHDAAEPEGDIDDSFDFGANIAPSPPPPKAAVNARPNRRAGF